MQIRVLLSLNLTQSSSNQFQDYKIKIINLTVVSKILLPQQTIRFKIKIDNKNSRMRE